MLLLLLLLLLALVQTGSVTQKVFVDPSGNDAAAGTAASPLHTLPEAQRRVRRLLRNGSAKSLEVVMQPGQYFNTSMQFTADDSPPTGGSITWRAAMHGTASVYAGARIVGPWRQLSGSPSIWVTVLPRELLDERGRARFGALVDGDRSAVIARAPDYGSGFLKGVASYSDTGFTWSTESGLPPFFDCVNATCSVITRAGYSSDIRPILSTNLTNRSLVMVGKNHTDPSTPLPLGQPPSVVLQGAVELISAPGEWAVRGGRLYYWPYPPHNPGSRSGWSPANRTITAPSVQKMMAFVGSDARQLRVRGISLVGLNLVGSSMPTEYIYGCVGSDEIPDGPGSLERPCSTAVGMPNTTPARSAQGLIFTENATKIAIVNCSIRAAGISAVWLQEASSAVRIEGNYIDDIAGFGVYANGIAPNDTRYETAASSYVNHQHTIRNNVITGGGRMIEYGSGVWFFQSGDNQITNNLISHFPRDAIGFYGVCCHEWNAEQSPLGNKYWGQYMSINGVPNGTISTFDVLHCRNNLVEFNELANVNRQGIDGGTIESWGTGLNNSWSFNAVHDQEGLGEVFFADDFSPGLTVKGNVVFEVSDMSLAMMKSLNMSVESNTFADCEAVVPFYYDFYHLPAANMSSRNNLLWNLTQPGTVLCDADLNPANGTDCQRPNSAVPCENCASLYSSMACWPDSLNKTGLSFATANLSEELHFGNTLACQHGEPTFV